MKNEQNQSIESQILAVLEAHPHIIQSYVDEAMEDYLFGKIMQESETGEYMSREEFKKIIEE